MIDGFSIRKSSEICNINIANAFYQRRKILNTLSDKLKGIEIEGKEPMTVKEQISYLIKEATKEQNLAVMYHGWSAHW